MISNRPSDRSGVKMALLAREARAQHGAAEILRAEPVAIVGLGCRIAGANGPDAYWALLRDGVDAIRSVPSDRWNADAFYDADPAAPGKMTTRWGGFMDEVDQFDPAFFGIAPREAAGMDPQQRLLLEVAWEALEHAGMTQGRLAGSATGVFFAIYNNDFAMAQYRDRGAIDAYTALGTLHSIAAGRLSYLLDLRGPSLVIDTACSSSLVAVHMACQSLRARDCDLALAGGSSLILGPDAAISLSKWGFMAPDGRCKPFDASANGFVRGEGCGVIALKRLGDALADGDRVLAVVRGSAVNQDGRSSVLTAPNGPAQEQVVRDALAAGMVTADRIGYVEAHGTGTSIGDPIELEALANVLGQPGDGRRCSIGAVKANIGHLEAAAGIAGVIKVVLALQHAEIPRQLHYRRLNPAVSLDGTRLEIAASARPWRRDPDARLAGVSAFGFGGTNAHVVIEEAPDVPVPADDTSGALVLPLSARTEPALRAMAARFRDRLASADGDGNEVRDICATAALRRTHFEERLSVAGETRGDLLHALDAFVDDRVWWSNANGRSSSSVPQRPVFVFTGQGPQRAGMGMALYANEPAFREALDACNAAFARLAGWSIIDELRAVETATRVGHTVVAQPTIFALQVALAALWTSRGIRPGAVVGHSVGEVAAAHVAGVFDLETAAWLVWHRGRLMQQATDRGRMASVALPAGELTKSLADMDGRVVVGAINGPRSSVISGDVAAVDEVIDRLEQLGASCRRLPVTYAFHSTQMAPIAAELAEVIRDLAPRAETVPFVSTVTGTRLDGASLTAGYWHDNVALPVRFHEAIDALLEDDHRVFLEIGPHPVLRHYVKECADARGRRVAIVASLHRDRPESLSIAASCGALHVAGASIGWSTLYPGRRRWVDLPSYPWQHSSYGIGRSGEATKNISGAGPDAAGPTPFHGRVHDTAFASGRIVEVFLSAGETFLRDHVIDGRLTVPAVGILQLAFTASKQAVGHAAAGLADLEIKEPLFVDDAAGALRLQVRVGPHEGGRRAAEIACLGADGGWRVHATATLLDQASTGVIRDLASAEARCTDLLSREQHERDLDALGIGFGPAFLPVSRVARGDSEAVGSLELPPTVADEADRYAVHPVLLDGSLQVLAQAAAGGATAFGPALPVAIDRVAIFAPAGAAGRVHAIVRPSPPQSRVLTGDIALFTHDGELAAILEGVRLVRREHAAAAPYRYSVDWESAAESPPVSGPWSGEIIVIGSGNPEAENFAESLRALTNRVNVVPEVGAIASHLERCVGDGDGAVAIVHAGLLAHRVDESRDRSEQLEQLSDAARESGALFDLARALTGRVNKLSCIVVTRGAQAVRERDRVEVAQAPAWGLVRTLRLEIPDVRWRLADLDPAGEIDLDAFVAWLGTRAVEPDVAFRGGRVLAPRLTRRAAMEATRSVEAMALAISERGSVENVVWREATRRTPGPGDVEIRVTAAGLNFRDVLNVLGTYPGDAGALGAECVGVVEAVGDGVSHIRAGDRVVAVAVDTFRSYVSTSARLVTRIPSDIEDVDAATVPIAFLTAEQALTRLARLSRGERVLIHAAAGGVGLAAVQVALRLGAEIFATAGSPEKQAYLRALGIHHVMSSRSLDFVDDVRARTGGHGVDVVLNSLAGDFIDGSVDVLAPGGRFVEIGRTNVWSPEQFAESRPDAAYWVLYMGDQFEVEPDESRALLDEILGRMTSGEYHPLPATTFSMEDARAAFRFMAQARHTGKVVLTTGRRPSTVRGESTYLITGGTGALGRHIADALVRAGARRLVLTGRSEPTAELRAHIAAWEREGVVVSVQRGDVSNVADVDALLAGIDASDAPLAGVIHAAGIVDDGIAANQTCERFRRVLAPKMIGGWLLHLAHKNRPLDFFSLFSSAASLLGSPGQATYAAANAFLDALAHHRQSHGLSGLSIDWGVWGDAGMVAALDAAGRSRLDSAGLLPIDPEGAAEICLDLCRTTDGQIAVLAADWTTYERVRPGTAIVAKLTTPRDRGTHGAAAHESTERLDALVRRTPLSDRLRVVSAEVRRLTLDVLGLSPRHVIDDDRGFRDIGLDSLMGVELRTRLQAATGRPIPATVAFDYPTIAALSRYVLRDVLDAAVAEKDGPPAVSPHTDITELSDAQAEALLKTELDSLTNKNSGH